jgi:hypothetical protein
MAKPKQFKAQDFIDAIPGTGGIIVAIARKVGCNWHTAKRYIETYPTIKAAYDDECAAIDDLAVSTVLKAIKDGDVSTAKWWLAKKRKSEFGDSVDISGTVNHVIVVNWDDGENHED